MDRTYTELSSITTFEGRFAYLRLDGDVGCVTFGSARFVNQDFYRSREWKDARLDAIYRDNGCDLGAEGFDIHRRPTVHHINPLTQEDILSRSPKCLDPENLITTTHDTHNAIHYGDERLLPRPFVERYEGDTALWQPV